jgi:hypothetical protein
MISFVSVQGGSFSTTFKNSLLKFTSTSGLNPDNTNIKNEDPKFQNYFTQKMNLRVKADSPAKGKGVGTNNVTAIDIVGNPRTGPLTIGAYQ